MIDSVDFEDIYDNANLGKEPSQNYKIRLGALDNIVRECMHISHRYGGIPSPTARHFYASVLFTCLINKGVSLVSLAPYSPWAAKKIENWDYATAAVLARTMLEVRLAYYYLCTDPCSDEEWQCRWNIFNLHDCTARRRLSDSLGKMNEVLEYDKQAGELRERLKANNFFNSLLSGQQKKLLNGQTAYLMPLEEIAERAGLEKAKFRFLYALFSNHVHSLPMSFYRMGDGKEDRGRGLPSPIEENSTTLCLSLACVLLTSTRNEVQALFADIVQKEKPDSQFAEEKILETLAEPDKYSVGETVEIFRSIDTKIEVKRLGEDELEATYYHVPSDTIVLKRFVGDTGTYLQSLDPYFWSVEVNGEAATEMMVEHVGTVPYAFKVDHVNRKLSFKIER